MEYDQKRHNYPPKSSKQCLNISAAKPIPTIRGSRQSALDLPYVHPLTNTIPSLLTTPLTTLKLSPFTTPNCVIQQY